MSQDTEQRMQGINTSVSTGQENCPDTIRAISRGIAVLKFINRAGSANLTTISRSTNIPYPTVCRIVNTLLEEALIEREENRPCYKPTLMVQSLATGYKFENHLVTTARPLMEKLCQEIVWPVALASRIGSCMVLLDSTHAMTTLTFDNYYPGHTMPISDCATGKAYLAFTDKNTRSQILQNLTEIDFGWSRQLPIEVCADDDFWEKIRKTGYAIQPVNTHSSEPGRTASIAAPIMVQGNVVASLGAIFFRKTMKLSDAQEQFADKLVETAEAIARSL